MEMNARFTSLSRHYIEALLRASPVRATALGDTRFNKQLDDVSPEARQAHLGIKKDVVKQLEQIDRSALDRENQIDYEILLHHLKREIWATEHLREWEWNPLVSTQVAGNAIYGLLARSEISDSIPLLAAADRCRQFPQFFEQSREALDPKQCSQIHTKTAIEQNRGIHHLLEQWMVARIDQLAPEQKQRVADAIDIAKQAVEQQQAWLEDELLPKSHASPRLSEELYREKFAHEFPNSGGPEEFKLRTRKLLKDIHDEMFTLACDILTSRDPSYIVPHTLSSEEQKAVIRNGLEIAYQDTVPSDQLVEAAKESLHLATDFVRNSDLISFPDEPLEIHLMPEFRRGVSVAYCDAPGPLEKNGKTFYAVSPPSATWTAEQTQSYLREYNVRSLHNLTVHEAMPGHHVQYVLARGCPSPVREVLRSGTFIEGWAVYSEGMMVEEGFLDNDPLMRLIVLKWRLRVIGNALLDQMVHLDKCDESEAMNLLVGDAFQEEREAAGKFQRAQLTSVQLSTYLMGLLNVTDIRESAEQAWGREFRLKRFHDTLLKFGAPPPPIVKALLLDEEIPRVDADSYDDLEKHPVRA